MAKTIPQLTDATTVNAADELVIQQGGITKRATATELLGGTATVTSTGTTTGRALKDRFADVVNVKDFGAVGDGVADDTAAFVAAVAAGKIIFVPKGIFLIASNLSIGADKILCIEGQLSLSSGAVLSFNNRARVEAGRWQIFSGAGSVTNLREVYPEWFGVIHSSTNLADARMAEWQKAADACADNAIISLQSGFYPWDGTAAIQLTKGQRLVGQGWHQTTIRCATDACFGFEWTSTFAGGATGLRWDGTSSGIASGVVMFCNGQSASRIVLTDLWITGCWEGIRIQGTVSEPYNVGVIRDVTIRNVFNRAITYNNVENFYTDFLFINVDTAGETSVASGVSIQNNCKGNTWIRMMISNVKSGNGLSVTNDLGAISRDNDARWNVMYRCSFDDCSFGAQLNHTEMWIFSDCWFSSNGRLSQNCVAGSGLWIRNASNIYLKGGTASNNGERGIRLSALSKDVFIHGMQIAGNNVNDTSHYNVFCDADTSDFQISNCFIGGATAGWNGNNALGGVFVSSGNSDRYDIIYNRFVSLPSGVVDNGSGSDKDVTTGNRSRAAA